MLMSNIIVRICERCGEKQWQDGKSGMLKIRKPHPMVKVIFTKFWNGNSSGYDYTEEQIHLCPKCAAEFEDWLKEKH